MQRSYVVRLQIVIMHAGAKLLIVKFKCICKLCTHFNEVEKLSPNLIELTFLGRQRLAKRLYTVNEKRFVFVFIIYTQTKKGLFMCSFTIISTVARSNSPTPIMFSEKILINE